MTRIKDIKKIWILIFLMVALFSQTTQAQAWGWERHRHHHYYVHYPYPSYGRVLVVLPGGFASLVIGGSRYYYCDGVYYQRGSGGYIIVPTPIGAVVETYPPGCRRAIVNGVTYYTADGIYYRYTSYGYEVVSQPVITEMVQTMPTVPSRVEGVTSQEKFGISDIIVLSKSGVNDNVIIDKIISTGSVFRLDVEEVQVLRKQGVSSRVINFMLSGRR